MLAKGHYYREGVRLMILAAALGVLSGVLLQASPPKDKEKAENPEKADKRRAKAIQKEMESAYKKWLEDEVPYIITDQERGAFKKLTTDDEREQFIEQFWERRNPNPGSMENEFKEEYYRRIAYANERYASGLPGWRTDRGRIYIMYGPPDEIEDHSSGGAYIRPTEEGGGETSTFPFEQWRYRYIDGIGTNIILEFVDTTMTGEYHLSIDPGEKDALKNVPGAGLTDYEQFMGTGKSDRQGRDDGTTMGADPMLTQGKEFDRIDLYAKIFKPPEVKFKDLKAVVTSRLNAQLLPFDVRTDFLRVTEDTVLTPITIQVENRDVEFQNKGGVMHAVLDIYGQVSGLAGRVVGNIQESVVLDVPESDYQHYVTRRSVYQKALPLRPGRYKLTVVVKDTISGHMGSMELGLVVPHYQDDKLSSSSLILADQIQPLPTNQVGSGPFVIGGVKVRPSVKQSFTRDQDLGIYMQVYNLGLDAQTHKPTAEIEYDIAKDGKSILNQTEEVAKMPNASQQITLQKTLSLKQMQPGKYTLQIKVKDDVNKQTLTPSATFELK